MCVPKLFGCFSSTLNKIVILKSVTDLSCDTELGGAAVLISSVLLVLFRVPKPENRIFGGRHLMIAGTSLGLGNGHWRV